MARSRGANATLNHAFETLYGTAPASGYFSLPFSAGNLGETQALLNDDLLGLGREPTDPAHDVIDNDGAFTVPVDLRNFGTWLKMMLGQDTVTNASSVYTHVFNSGALVLPSSTIEIGYPEVPSYSQNYGIVANTMRIGMARSGLLSSSINVVGQGETLLTATGAGTPTSRAIQRFSQFQGGISVDGTPAGSIESAEFTINNNLDKVAVIRSDGRIAGADPAQFQATGQIVVLFQDTTILAKAASGAPSSLQFGWGSGSASLNFLFPRAYLNKVQRPITGPAGIRATFPFRVSRDTGTGHALTVTLVNDVATY